MHAEARAALSGIEGVLTPVGKAVKGDKDWDDFEEDASDDEPAPAPVAAAAAGPAAGAGAASDSALPWGRRAMPPCEAPLPPLRFAA